MTIIQDRLRHVLDQIIAAETEFGRSVGSVKLLAVTKSQSIEQIQQAIVAGQRDFGENYLQEALTKIAHLQHDNLQWHFIGPIQTNKTKKIAEHFAWVHSVCRLKIAERLNAQRPEDMPPLNVCLQVNISEDPHKDGVTLQELPELASAIATMPRLKLRGLMTIPFYTQDIGQQRRYFRQLRKAKEQLQQQGLNLDTLSMGMSEDFESAIAEGATMVRIGSAIFGPRHRT